MIAYFIDLDKGRCAVLSSPKMKWPMPFPPPILGFWLLPVVPHGRRAREN